MKFLLFAFLSLSTASFAWDGQREGFLLGVGAGTASMAYVASKPVVGFQESYSNLLAASTSRIGYAFSNTSAIELYGVTVAGNDGYSGLNYQNWSTDSVDANSWFGGVGFVKSGQTTKIKGKDLADDDFGFGLNLGYGREIANHTSFEIGLFLGGFKDKHGMFANDKLTSVAGITLTVNLLGY